MALIPSATVAAPPPGAVAAPARNARFGQLLFLLVAGIIVLSGCLVAAALHTLRGEALQSGARLTASLAHAIEEQTTRTFQAVDQRLQLAEVSLAALDATGGLTPQSASTLLREQISQMPFVHALRVTDAAGRLKYDADVRNIGLDLAERSYVRVFLERPDTTLHIGAPARSRSTGQWQISVARALRQRNGAFAGVLIAALEPAYFAEIWATLDLGPGGSAALFKRDGVLLMRSPPEGVVIGSNFADTPLFAKLLPAQSTGAYQNSSAIDGIVREYAYRVLSAQPGLVVVVGKSHDAMLAPWRQLAGLALAVWAAAAIGIVVLALLLNRAQQRRRRAEDELALVAQRLSFATEAAHIGVWDWDLTSNQWCATPGHFVMMGYPADARTSTSEQWLAHLHPDDRAAVATTMAAALAPAATAVAADAAGAPSSHAEPASGAGYPYRYEARLRQPDGSFRWIEVLGTRMPAAEPGQHSHVLGVCIDIHGRKQTELALRASEERYRGLVDWSPEPIAIHRDGVLLYVNPAAVKLLGAPSAPALVGRPILELIHPAFHEEQLTRVQHIFSKTFVTPRAELQLVRLDGQLLDVEVEGRLVDFEGAPAIHVAMHDISARKQTEANAAAQTRALEMIAQGRPAAETLTALLRQCEEHLPGIRCSVLVLDADGVHLRHCAAPNLPGAYVSAIDGIAIGPNAGSCGTAVFRRERVIVEDIAADPLWVAFRALALPHGLRACWATPIADEQGNMLGSFAIYYDTPRRPAAEHVRCVDMATHVAALALRTERTALALRASETRFRAIFEQAAVGVAQVAPDGRWMNMNQRLCDIVGYTREVLLTKTFQDITFAPDLDADLDHVRQLLAGELASYEMEKRYLRSDGALVWVNLTVSLVRAASGAPDYFISIVEDISARKDVEAARIALEAQLRESQKMEAIGTLAGGIAHDFNNILATILGNTALAREDAGGQPVLLTSLDEVHKAALRARDLVQQILSFSRRQPTALKRIDLAPVVEESVRLLRATLPARVKLELQLAPDVPPVLADATQIEQVLINLGTNAAQAIGGRPGHVSLRLDTVILDTQLVRAHPALGAMLLHHPGRTVRLVVQDDGPGMDAATQQRIFDPFFTTKLVGEGTGLGLSVVHGIMQTHAGAIMVDSAPGRGSTFALLLPVAEGAVPDVTAGDVAAAAAPVAGRGQHILYVDDDESVVFLVRRLLERRGFRVSAFIDANEALAALGATAASFDLVVTDYNMPVVSGLDLARAVRRIRADLPVVVASGFIDETLRTQAAGAGVRELIFKAHVMEEFCEVVQRFADKLAPHDA